MIPAASALLFVAVLSVASIGSHAGLGLRRLAASRRDGSRLLWLALAGLCLALADWSCRLVAQPGRFLAEMMRAPLATPAAFAGATLLIALGLRIWTTPRAPGAERPRSRVAGAIAIGLGLCAPPIPELADPASHLAPTLAVAVLLERASFGTLVALLAVVMREDGRPAGLRRPGASLILGTGMAVLARFEQPPPGLGRPVAPALSAAAAWLVAWLLLLASLVFAAGLAASLLDRRFRELVRRETRVIRASRRRAIAALDQLPVGVVIADRASGRRVFANRVAREVLSRWPGEAQIGAHALGRALLARETTDRELQARRGPDGQTVTFEVSAAPVFDIDGQQILAMTTFQEVSARIRAETELRRSQRMDAFGQLTGGIAHDANNLLGAVISNLEVLESRLADPMSRTLLRNALLAAERGTRLHEQLLRFSRRQALNPVPTDVNAAIGGMTALLASAVGGGCEIRTSLDPDLWIALADPTQLEMILLNLALNARDAMPAGGAITLATENLAVDGRVAGDDLVPGDYVRLSVHDEGAGIDSATLARVFEPFFTTKAPGRGSGLGLPQVLGVAQQLGGTVRIRSAPGEGTTVGVFLRRGRNAPAPPPETEPDHAPDQERDHDRIFLGRLVLLVDDDFDIRVATRALLVQLGFTVEEAADARAAILRVATLATLDAVVMDYAMPGMSGAEAAARIQAIRPGLPILMITGYAEPQKLPGMNGRFPVLQKPFRLRALAAELGGLLATPGLVPPP